MVKKKGVKKGGALDFVIFWGLNIIGIAYMVSPLDLAPYTGLDDGFVGFYIFNNIKARYFG